MRSSVPRLSAVSGSVGQGSTVEATCWFGWVDLLEPPPTIIANPIEEYDTLPYAMTFNGRALAEEEVRQLVMAEQKRRGKAVLDAVKDGAKGVADQVRAGVGG